MRARPDEVIYARQARTIRERGIHPGLRALTARFLADAGAAAYPSPLRWLWIVARGITDRLNPRLLTIASALACLPLIWWLTGSLLAVVLCAVSPLLWTCGRTQLQDTAVAALTLGAIGCALHGHPVALCLVVLALLAVKEAGALVLPAIAAVWWMAGHRPLIGAVSLGVATVAWVALTRALVGPHALAVARHAASGHDTAYTREHQSGGVVRLAHDLWLLMGPLALFWLLAPITHAPLAVAALIILLTHGLSPVQNARTILATDLLLRALGATAITTFSGPPWVGALTVCAIGAWSAMDVWRFRRIYDPVTEELKAAL